MKKENSWPIEKLIGMIPVLGSYFILYGCIDVKTFYSVFKVDIMSYMSTQEILTYFLKDVHAVIFIVSLFFFIFFGLQIFQDKILIQSKQQIKKHKANLKALETLMDSRKKDNKELAAIDIEQSLNVFSSSLDGVIKSERRLKKGKIILLSALLVCLSLLFFTFYITDSVFSWTLTVIGSAVFMYTVNYFTKNLKISLVILASLSLLFGAYNNSKSRAKNLKQNGNQVEFSIGNGTLCHSESKFMIGKTRDYIFIFDTTFKRTQIIGIDELDWIKIKSQ